MIKYKKYDTKKLSGLKDIIAEFVLTLAGILCIAVSVSMLSLNTGNFQDSGAGIPVLRGVFLISALALCVFRAYFEEYVFRKFIPEKLADFGSTEALAVTVSAALFAFLHSWEGFWGVFNAALSAIFLSFCYKRHKNLHIIASAHAVYNIIAYILLIIDGGA